MFSMTYTFEEASTIVDSITKSFADFWQSECDVMKEAMVKMDTHHTGRVPLRKLYDTTMTEDWRFAESEEYLRDMGVLDESSSFYGPQVLISNYIQAASNCIVSTP